MTKLSLTVSLATYKCIDVDDATARILGAQPGVPIASLLADEKELDTLKSHVEQLTSKSDSTFETLDLVFAAPNAPSGPDRAPIHGVFRSPIRSIHTCGPEALACFVHIALLDEHSFQLTAIEYSRKQREQKLRQEFGSWLLEEHIEKSVIATDPIGTVVFWNRFATELFQYAAEEAIGRNIMGLTPSEMTQEQGAEIFSNLLKGEHWKGFFKVITTQILRFFSIPFPHHQVRRKDSSQFMAHVTDTPVLDQEGQLRFIVGVSADYTPMHDLMDELKTLNANLEKEVDIRTKELLERSKVLRMVGAAVKESETGVFITEQDFSIVWSNDAVSRMTKLSENELQNMLPWDLPIQLHTNEDSGPEETRDLKQLFQKRSGSFTVEYKDGEINRIVAITAQSMPESKQCMFIMRDLTSSLLAAAAKRAAERAAAASRTKTEMMHMLSHEFRVPLQGIMGVASTTLSELAPEESTLVNDNWSTVLASSRLLLTLINNVLDLGKIEADMMQDIELSPVSVFPPIHESIEFCSLFAALSDTELVVDTADNDWAIRVNRTRLQQILVNLLSNAIKYAPAGSTVHVDVRQNTLGDVLAEAQNAGASDLTVFGQDMAGQNPHQIMTVISVRDEGRGIPAGEMGNLFTEFVQLKMSQEMDRTKERTGSGVNHVGQTSGTGLGLSLVLKFVTKMNGHIWAANSDSGGAVFSFCFPAANTGLVEARSPHSSMGELAHYGEFNPAALNVMLVDDSLINLKVLERMFHRVGVKSVVKFSDASKALVYLNEMEDTRLLPNLILSDLQMPMMSGMEFMCHLRELSSFESPPTVMACSADWTQETRETCLEAGFDGLLRKPLLYPDLKQFLSQNFA